MVVGFIGFHSMKSSRLEVKCLDAPESSIHSASTSFRVVAYSVSVKRGDAKTVLLERTVTSVLRPKCGLLVFTVSDAVCLSAMGSLVRTRKAYLLLDEARPDLLTM